MKEKDYYWDSFSEVIGRILTAELKKDMSICEIGFSGGHFLEYLYDEGYRELYGIEIRETQYEKTEKKFSEKNLNIHLICEDVLNISEKYDAIFATGILQFLGHISEMSKIAIFTVPEILEDRNMESNQLVAVSGCKEYRTGNIPYELSQFYNIVNVGKIDEKLTGTEDALIYYICRIA